jgi:hypothetical protein
MAPFSTAFGSAKTVTTKAQIKHAVSKMSLRITTVQKQIDDLNKADENCMTQADTNPDTMCTISPLEGSLGLELDYLNSAVLAGTRALVLNGPTEDAFLRAYAFEVASDYISNESQKSLAEISASEVAKVALAQNLMPYANLLQNAMNDKLLNTFLKKLKWVTVSSEKTNMLRIFRKYAFMK